MKFSCDRCDAQYMISDEKVGPNGVKVRCKKCSHVILIRRAAENGASAGEAPTLSPTPTPSGEGLDAELGQAFDNAFGGMPAADPDAAGNSASAASSPAAPAPDPDSTQGVSAEEAANLAARSAPPEPAATEWYVAIGQAQVGPLPLAEVRRKWEAGDVGPDSLVWRPGMGDWAPLKGVSDLAAYLAPVPRGSVRPKPSPTPAPTFGRAASPVAPAAAQAVKPDVSWKPVGASALAALASEELSSQAAEAKAEAKPALSAKSLVDALPDGGGVDPTGAIPLQIKALESTGEEPVARSSVARGAEKLRKKRSSTRALVATIVVLFLGLLGVGGYAFKDQLLALTGRPQQPQQPVAIAPEPPQPAAKTAPAPTPPKAVEPATASATPAQPVATPPAAPPATATAEPAKAEPTKAEPTKAAEPPAKAAPVVAAREETKAEPSRTAKGRAEKKPAREPVARTARTEPAPAPPPPAPRKKSNDVLDFDASSSDSALDEALGNGKSGRSVYVPPAPGGGGGGLAERVTDSQVNETIMTRVSSLQQCLADSKSGGGGVLKMRWSISPDGAVQNLKCITPETANTPFASCVTGVLKTLRFPKTQQGRTDVTFPFKF